MLCRHDIGNIEEETGCVVIHDAVPFHEYTVSFLAYIIWDPVHMYNAVTNEWKDFEHQITFDVRQPKTTNIHWSVFANTVKNIHM